MYVRSNGGSEGGREGGREGRKGGREGGSEGGTAGGRANRWMGGGSDVPLKTRSAVENARQVVCLSN